MFDHNYHNLKQILFFPLGQGGGQNKYTLKSKTKTVFYRNQIYFPPKLSLSGTRKLSAVLCSVISVCVLQPLVAHLMNVLALCANSNHSGTAKQTSYNQVTATVRYLST